MVTLDEAFDAWLDEKPYSVITSRRDHAHILGINLLDLKWAFTAGWNKASLQVVEYLTEELKV